MKLTKEQLEEDLCNYCSIPKESRGIHLGPNGPYGCDGCRCDDAYERYLEQYEEEEE